MFQPGATPPIAPAAPQAPTSFFTPNPATGLPYGDVAQAFDAMFGSQPGQFTAPMAQPQFQQQAQYQAPAAFSAPTAQPGQFPAPMAQPQFPAPMAQPQFQAPLVPPGSPAMPQAPAPDIAQDIIARYSALHAPQPQQPQGQPPGGAMPSAFLPQLPQLQPPGQPAAGGANDAFAALVATQAQQTELLSRIAQGMQPAAAPAPAPAPIRPVDYDPTRDAVTPQEQVTFAESMPMIDKLVRRALHDYDTRAQAAVVAPLLQRVETVTAQLNEANTRLTALGSNVEQTAAINAETALFTGLDPNIVAHVRGRSPHYQAALRAPLDASLPQFTVGDAMKAALARNDIAGVQQLLRRSFTPQVAPQPTVTAPQAGAPLQAPGTPQAQTQPSMVDFANLQAAQIAGKIAPDAADAAMAAMFGALVQQVPAR